VGNSTPAFLGEDVADDLELEPRRGRRVITADSDGLPERANDSELRGEGLAEYRKRICEKLQVVQGKIVRRAK
jgi:hypothetical protein